MDAPFRPSAALFDVYLRLRPSNAVDKERFLDVEGGTAGAPTHITIRPPSTDYRKRAVEKFAFTRVFEEDAGQLDIFKSTGVLPLVEGVLGAPGREGRDGLLATLGVTGSGKSHTILGSKSQRGLTQLALDVLFQNAGPQIARVEDDSTVFSSLCDADVSEAHLLPAGHFLDSTYGDSCPSISRATTPALVCEPPASINNPSLRVPGAFPSAIPEPERSVFDRLNRSTAASTRLYPSLSLYKSQQGQIISPCPSKSTVCPTSNLARMKESIVSLTRGLKEASFLSAPSSNRKNVPRLSALPRLPSIDELGAKMPVDDKAEYAVVVSMYEVYNDRIFDLLSNATVIGSKTQQKRRALLFKSTEFSPDRKVVAGLRKIVCSDLDEALLVLETGLQERRVAGTGSNAVSSRSHGFFCIDVKKRHRGSVVGPWTSSTLTIVDLAGSERARTANTAGATLAEAGKINESLMYLGQCMQMQSDSSNSTSHQPNLVPYRQCKLTELLFSNTFVHGHAHKASQKAIMIVTADPLGDLNATSQILRYSALAREVTVPRIPSITQTILSNAAAKPFGRSSPSTAQEELEVALAEMAKLREELEIAQLQLQEETHRRQEAETSWTAAEARIEEVEAEIREEVWSEFEPRLAQEQHRWRAARDEEADRQDEHMDRKLDLLVRGLDYSSEDKENSADAVVKDVDTDRVVELEDENASLKEKVARMERGKGLRSPSKKMRVLKARKWEGSGVCLDGSP